MADETFDTVQGRAGSKAFGPSIGADRKESAVVEAFLLSFAVIFVAELGDKSQLMALAFATRFKTIPVLIAITAATAVVHLASVGIGAVLGAAIPTTAMSIVGGLAFLFFGAWTLRGDELSEEDEKSTHLSAKNVVIAVGTVFFLAELGDKTMLATITLATDNGAVGTWAGSTVGMVAADALAIWVGKALGERLPEKAIKIGASLAFFAFGAVMLIDALA